MESRPKIVITDADAVTAPAPTEPMAVPLDTQEAPQPQSSPEVRAPRKKLPILVSSLVLFIGVLIAAYINKPPRDVTNDPALTPLTRPAAANVAPGPQDPPILPPKSTVESPPQTTTGEDKSHQAPSNDSNTPSSATPSRTQSAPEVKIDNSSSSGDSSASSAQVPPLDENTTEPQVDTPANQSGDASPYVANGFFSVQLPSGWSVIAKDNSYRFRKDPDIAIVIADSDYPNDTNLEMARRADRQKQAVAARLNYRERRLYNSPNEHIGPEGNERSAVTLIYEEKSPETGQMRYMQKFCFQRHLNGRDVAASLTTIRPLASYKDYSAEFNSILSTLKWLDQ